MFSVWVYASFVEEWFDFTIELIPEYCEINSFKLDNVDWSISSRINVEDTTGS